MYFGVLQTLIMQKKLYFLLIAMLINGFFCSSIRAGVLFSEDSIQQLVTDTQYNINKNLAFNTLQDGKDPWFSKPYPNPIKDFVTLDYNIPANNNTAQIRISDLTGKTLKVFKLDSFSGKIRINMSSFTKGMYFLTIYYNGNLIKSNTLILGANN